MLSVEMHLSETHNYLLYNDKCVCFDIGKVQTFTTRDCRYWIFPFFSNNNKKRKMQKCLFPNHTQNNFKSIFAFEGLDSDKHIGFVHRNLFKVELLNFQQKTDKHSDNLISEIHCDIYCWGAQILVSGIQLLNLCSSDLFWNEFPIICYEEIQFGAKISCSRILLLRLCISNFFLNEFPAMLWSHGMLCKDKILYFSKFKGKTIVFRQLTCITPKRNYVHILVLN